jgi:uncharacterized protein (TIGR00255 family)
MTAFGSGSFENKALRLEVEIKGVNSRYLDVSFRIPRNYSCSEQSLRERVGRVASRGRIEVNVNKLVKNQALKQTFERPLFDYYFNIYRNLLREKNSADPQAVSKAIVEILRKPEVFSTSGASDERLPGEEKGLQRAFSAALKAFEQSAFLEGKKITSDILKRLKKTTALRVKIESIVVGQPDNLKAKLTARLSGLISNEMLDPARLATELALMADRLDVTEELVRLRSHEELFVETAHTPPCGRKLDFILQEILREYNTISSKAQCARTQALVIEAKAEIEKIREQVQNIE